jgi:hypothetical protein
MPCHEIPEHLRPLLGDLKIQDLVNVSNIGAISGITAS